MKNILFINHSGTLHGAETVLIELLSQVSSKNGEYKTFVVYNKLIKSKIFADKVSTLPISSIIGTSFRFLGGSNFRNIAVLIYNIFACIRVITFILRNKIDIVYSNTSVNPLGIVCAILTNKRHIWHFHEPVDVSYGLTKTTNKYYKWLLRYKKNTIVFIANNQKTDWEANLNITLQNQILIYNPIKKIKKNEKTKELLNTIVFGFIGSLETRKNVPLLIRTFALLEKQYPEKSIKLQITGHGDEQENIKKLLLEVGIKNVEMSDYCYETNSFYSNIDVLVLPSFSEMMPLVALEAMSVEKATIMTKHTGFYEILENNIDCIYINPESESDLYNAMEKLLLDTAFRTQLAKNGFEKVHKIDFNKRFHSSFDKLFKS